MRIAHVLPALGPSGASSATLQQTAELARRGHQVTLYTAGEDADRRLVPPGVGVRLHRRRRALAALPFDLESHVDEHDVVHLHQGADLLTAAAGWMAGARSLPYVLQTHGLIGPEARARSRATVLDAVTVRKVLGDAAAVLSLTEQEDTALTAVESGITPVRLRNGIAAAPALPGPDPGARPQVVFCARLSRRKRVLAFALLAVALLEQGVDADFVAHGPDEGDLAEFEQFVADKGWGERIRYAGPVEPSAVRPLLARATVFVLPSVDEPFPMTLLEALSVGTPTVITDSCHIAADLAERAAAAVSEPAASRLAETVGALLADPESRRALGEAGRRAVAEAYGIEPVVDRLEQIYAAAVTRSAQAAKRPRSWW